MKRTVSSELLHKCKAGKGEVNQMTNQSPSVTTQPSHFIAFMVTRATCYRPVCRGNCLLVQRQRQHQHQHQDLSLDEHHQQKHQHQTQQGP